MTKTKRSRESESTKSIIIIISWIEIFQNNRSIVEERRREKERRKKEERKKRKA